MFREMRPQTPRPDSAAKICDVQLPSSRLAGISQRRIGGFLASGLMMLGALVQTGCIAPLKTPKQPLPVWNLDGEVPKAMSLSSSNPLPISPTTAAPSPQVEPCALVLLPGSFDHPKDFARHGFHDALEARYPQLRIVAADAHMGYYRRRSVVERLQHDVVGPLKEQGYRVWIAGISLGGLGSLLYAQQTTEPHLALDGLIAMAPFLGTDALIRELQDAGGPLAWQAPDPLPQPRGRGTVGYSLWTWLVDWYHARQQPGTSAPEIVLAYGLKDSFAPAGELLAQLLPPDRVFVHPGGHDWNAWRPLWSDVVQAGVLDGCTPPKEGILGQSASGDR